MESLTKAIVGSVQQRSYDATLAQQATKLSDENLLSLVNAVGAAMDSDEDTRKRGNSVLSKTFQNLLEGSSESAPNSPMLMRERSPSQSPLMGTRRAPPTHRNSMLLPLTNSGELLASPPRKDANADTQAPLNTSAPNVSIVHYLNAWSRDRPVNVKASIVEVCRRHLLSTDILLSADCALHDALHPLLSVLCQRDRRCLLHILATLVVDDTYTNLPLLAFVDSYANEHSDEFTETAASSIVQLHANIDQRRRLLALLCGFSWPMHSLFSSQLGMTVRAICVSNNAAADLATLALALTLLTSAFQHSFAKRANLQVATDALLDATFACIEAFLSSADDGARRGADVSLLRRRCLYAVAHLYALTPRGFTRQARAFVTRNDAYEAVNDGGKRAKESGAEDGAERLRRERCIHKLLSCLRAHPCLIDDAWPCAPPASQLQSLTTWQQVALFCGEFIIEESDGDSRPASTPSTSRTTSPGNLHSANASSVGASPRVSAGSVRAQAELALLHRELDFERQLRHAQYVALSEKAVLLQQRIDAMNDTQAIKAVTGDVVNDSGSHHTSLSEEDTDGSHTLPRIIGDRSDEIRFMQKKMAAKERQAQAAEERRAQWSSALQRRIEHLITINRLLTDETKSLARQAATYREDSLIFERKLDEANHQLVALRSENDVQRTHISQLIEHSEALSALLEDYTRRAKSSPNRSERNDDNAPIFLHSNEALQARIDELDDLLRTTNASIVLLAERDAQQREQIREYQESQMLSKKTLEEAKMVYKVQLEAAEKKYELAKGINVGLHARILELAQTGRRPQP